MILCLSIFYHLLIDLFASFRCPAYSLATLHCFSQSRYISGTQIIKLGGLFIFLFFSRQVLDFFGGSWFYAFLFLWFSAFLLLCFSAFCFPCFFAFPASLLFCFLFFLLLCFSASLFSLLLCFCTSGPFHFYSIIVLVLFFSHVFLLLYFLLLCFFASCIYCLFVFHFLLL